MASSTTLTPRELEVALAFARGLTYREVATKFGMTTSGARFHSENIRAKLGIAEKREIGRALLDRGLAKAEELVG